MNTVEKRKIQSKVIPSEYANTETGELLSSGTLAPLGGILQFFFIHFIHHFKMSIA